MTATAGRDARVALLARLIDDAGLFPPARLPMDEAVAAHERSRKGAYKWMLDRFISPASRLRELEAALPPANGHSSWCVSVVMDASAERWPNGIEADLEAARWFTEHAKPRAHVALFEAVLPPASVASGEREAVAGEVDRLLGRLEDAAIDSSAAPFLEVPVCGRSLDEIAAAIEGIARVRERAGGDGPRGAQPGAKLRCGGLAAEAFPSPEQVAGFIAACAKCGVPFKATAGLHHPFRHVDPGTGLRHHGFLNLAGGTALLVAGEVGPDELVELVGDEDASSFALTAEGFRWRDHRADVAAVGRSREHQFFGYGSCSFNEPVEDLIGLGVLRSPPNTLL